MINPNDIVGKQFSRLTVLNVIGKNKHGFYEYNCKCDCGKEKIIMRNSLMSNKTKSCGCLNSQLTSVRTSKRHSLNEDYLDLINKNFGYLTVIRRCDTINEEGRFTFICKCECGKETEVLKSNLISGRTLSCGCYNSELLKERHKQYRVLNGYDENVFINETLNTLRNATSALVKSIILELDNNQCVLCSEKINLHAHHIIPINSFLNLKDKSTYYKLYDINNLITLCKDCHKKSHGNSWNDINKEIEEILMKYRKNTIVNEYIKNKFMKIENNIIKFVDNFNYELIGIG